MAQDEDLRDNQQNFGDDMGGADDTRDDTGALSEDSGTDEEIK